MFALQQLDSIIRLCDPSVSSCASWVQNFIHFTETILFHPITNLLHASMVQEDGKFRVLSVELYVQWDPGIMVPLHMHAIMREWPQSVLGLGTLCK